MNIDDDELMKQAQSEVDLSTFEPRTHQWVQRGRYLGCHCHPHQGVFLPHGKDLVGQEGDRPVFA